MIYLHTDHATHSMAETKQHGNDHGNDEQGEHGDTWAHVGIVIKSRDVSTDQFMFDVGIAACSAIVNRRLFDRYRSLDDIRNSDNPKSWDEFRHLNRYVDKWGGVHTVISNIVSIVTCGSGPRGDGMSDRLVARICHRIFTAIGLRIPIIMENSNEFVHGIKWVSESSDPIKPIGEHIEIEFDDLFSLIDHILRPEYQHEQGTDNTWAHARDFSTIIVDNFDTLVGQSFDMVDYTNIESYRFHTNMIIPPVKLRNIGRGDRNWYTFRVDPPVIVDRPDAHSALTHVRYWDWSEHTPPIIPTSESNRESITSKHDDERPLDDIIAAAAKYKTIDPRRTDICTVCKTPLHSGVYMIENPHNGGMVMICSDCMVESRTYATFDIIWFTDYPRNIIEAVDMLPIQPEAKYIYKYIINRNICIDASLSGHNNALVDLCRYQSMPLLVMSYARSDGVRGSASIKYSEQHIHFEAGTKCVVLRV